MDGADESTLSQRARVDLAVSGTVSFTSYDGVGLDGWFHAPRSQSPVAVAVLAHGIAMDMDEGGMFVRLGDRLAEGGVAAVRFSFRGHGSSGGAPRGVTIAGELLDVEAVLTWVRSSVPGLPLVVVAASFGAVAVLESIEVARPDLLVLWNPVLDLNHTFVDPELPWGVSHFGPAARSAAVRRGYLLLDDTFEVGRVLLDEFGRYAPGDRFAATTMPALVVHAAEDTYVSFDIARSAAATRGASFHAVEGSDHGFDTVERENEAIEVTVSWTTNRLREIPS